MTSGLEGSNQDQEKANVEQPSGGQQGQQKANVEQTLKHLLDQYPQKTETERPHSRLLEKLLIIAQLAATFAQIAATLTHLSSPPIAVIPNDHVPPPSAIQRLVFKH